MDFEQQNEAIVYGVDGYANGMTMDMSTNRLNNDHLMHDGETIHIKDKLYQIISSISLEKQSKIFNVIQLSDSMKEDLGI